MQFQHFEQRSKCCQSTSIVSVNLKLFNYTQQQLLLLDLARPKEPSQVHLKTLQAITKILLESPNLDVHRLNPAWVRRTAHKPEELTDAECQTVVWIVRALSPYTPKRVKNSSGGTSPPTPNPASMIKVVLLSNHMLRYTGYSQFTRRFALAPSIASLHPVPLGAAALYDTLCWKAPGHFDIYDADGKPISSVAVATKNRGCCARKGLGQGACYWRNQGR
jgi:hypothetical protein